MSISASGLFREMWAGLDCRFYMLTKGTITQYNGADYVDPGWSDENQNSC